MAPKIKAKKGAHQSAANRLVSRPNRPKTAPGTNASGIGHQTNTPTVHMMPGGSPGPLPGSQEFTPVSPGLADILKSAPPGFSPIQQGTANTLQEVQALQNRGVQTSYDPHPGQAGWAQYGNLWVYDPQGPGQSGVGQDVRGQMALLADPYLAQQYKEQALQQLMGSGNDAVHMSSGNDSYDTLKQAILDTQQGKFYPGGVPNNPNLQMPQPTPPQQIPAPVTPAPTPIIPAPVSSPTSAPNPTPDQGSAVSPVTFSNAPTTNVQSLGNRNIPGFSAINHRPSALAPVAARMLKFGNLTRFKQP